MATLSKRIKKSPLTSHSLPEEQNERSNHNHDELKHHTMKQSTTTRPTTTSTSLNNASSSCSSPSSSSSSLSSTTTTSTTTAAVRGTLTTVLWRMASFVGTQYIFRQVATDPAILGRASLQLELQLSTVLFVSREGFRLALTRRTNTNILNNSTNDMNASNPKINRNRNSKTVNDDETILRRTWPIAWLTLPVSTLVASMALVWHLTSTCTSSGRNNNTMHTNMMTNNSNTYTSNDQADYRLAGCLVCLASALEGWAEPAVLSALWHMNVSHKASAEGAAALVKTVATVVALHYLQPRGWSVTAFGVAQVVYALVYAGVLYRSEWMALRRLRDGGGASGGGGGSGGFGIWAAMQAGWNGELDGPTMWMVVVFTGQGLVKHVLTEADRIVLTTLSSSYDQGVYAMGGSYGGLAARMLLQPLEENARLLWSRLGGMSATASPQQIGEDYTRASQKDNPLWKSYLVMVKLVLYIGMMFSCIAVNYTSLLLNLLAGRKWGQLPEAAAVLSAFCVYTAFLAANGMTEALVYAVASTQQLGPLGVAHGMIVGVFAVTAPLSVKYYGTVGLVGANVASMCLRTLYSIWFAVRFFSNHRHEQEKRLYKNNMHPTKGSLSEVQLRVVRDLVVGVVPHWLVCAAFGASYWATYQSLQQWTRSVAVKEPFGVMQWVRVSMPHIGVGVSCAIGIMTVAYFMETSFRASARSMLRPKQD